MCTISGKRIYNLPDEALTNTKRSKLKEISEDVSRMSKNIDKDEPYNGYKIRKTTCYLMLSIAKHEKHLSKKLSYIMLWR